MDFHTAPAHHWWSASSSAREGGEHAAQFGVARPADAPHSPPQVEGAEAPADEGVPLNGPARGVGQVGHQVVHPLNPHTRSTSMATLSSRGNWQANTSKLDIQDAVSVAAPISW